MECGSRTFNAGYPSSLSLGLGGWSYSTFLASTVGRVYLDLQSTLAEWPIYSSFPGKGHNDGVFCRFRLGFYIKILSGYLKFGYLEPDSSLPLPLMIGIPHGPVETMLYNVMRNLYHRQQYQVGLADLPRLQKSRGI